MLKYAPALGDAWRRAFGPFPDDYLVWDLETSGFSKDLDFLLEAGYCRVVGRRPVERGSVVFDWTRVLSSVEVEILRQRLARTTENMAANGATCQWTVEKLKAEGLPPADAMLKFVSLFADRPVLVGHNVWKFDAPMLDGWATRLTGRPAGIPPTAMIDTAVLVKSAQSGVVPNAGETYRDYTFRGLAAGGNKWKYSLSGYAFDALGLRACCGADRDAAHAADYDAWLGHLVFERMREVMGLA